MTPHVRAFVTDDADGAAAVLRAAFEATYRGLVRDDALDAHVTQIDEDRVLVSVERRAAKGGVTLVAEDVEDAGSVVAYAGAGPSRDLDRDRATTGELYALYVYPSAWGRGAGRALQREALEHLRAAGAVSADVWVLHGNEQAQGFYGRTGWTDEGTTREIAELGGAPAARFARPLPVLRALDPDSHARAVAEVHVQAWRDAYRGQMPDTFLDGLSVEAREAFWARPLPDGRASVAELDGRIVGFIATGPSRDDDEAAAPHELYAINVVAPAWGSGAGLALLRAGERALREAGAAQATLWVLATNARARRFYEREGWEADGAEKDDVRDGFTLHEVRYRRSFGPK